MRFLFVFIALSLASGVFSQSTPKKSKKIPFSLHGQATFIPQGVNKFATQYSGDNSFLPTEPTRTSFTATGFFAAKPFKNTYVVFNPEMAGGRGLSKTLGIGGFPNGEIYRVGNPAPQLFIARLLVEHRFPLTKRTEAVEDGVNQVAEQAAAADYISVLAGKFSLADYFDQTAITNDPRSQFMNWALMGSGAWDYPANTRGYTFGTVVQAKYKNTTLKAALTTVPTEANGQNLQLRWRQAMGTVIELHQKNVVVDEASNYQMNLFAGVYRNYARMGNYNQSILQAQLTGQKPDITQFREYGRTKTGYYVGLENNWKYLKHNINASNSDGKNEAWAFTEIDNSITTALQVDGALWKRKKDVFGLAYINNGLSRPHADYLKMGGVGFILGDGSLNYAREQILEAYYKCHVTHWVQLSPDVQYIRNPGYNSARGPAWVYALRVHFEL
jgi:high affinity Mn2+ porin